MSCFTLLFFRHGTIISHLDDVFHVQGRYLFVHQKPKNMHLDGVLHKNSPQQKCMLMSCFTTHMSLKMHLDVVFHITFPWVWDRNIAS